MSVFKEKPELKDNLLICNNCLNYIGGEKCKAFDFIPDLILLGKNKHDKPIKGQENDTIFEAK